MNTDRKNVWQDTSIISTFQRIVKTKPNEVALVYKDKRYSYLQLDEISNIIAANLLKMGIKKRSIISIHMNRSDEFIITILGILKCECIYLPISSAYPKTRIQQIIDISQMRYLISNDIKTCYQGVTNILYSQLCVENNDAIEYQNCYAEDIAYVIFTSGTTGIPKGIAIKHCSVIALIKSMEEVVCSLNPIAVQRIAILSSFAFDMSVAQMYLALLTGRTLYIIPDEIKSNIIHLADFLSRYDIQLFDITPSYLDLLIDFYILDSAPDIKVPPIIISGGEALLLDQVKKAYSNVIFDNCTIYNYYGPTECCVYTTYFKITKNIVNNMKRIPIGKPMAYAEVYILNEDLKKCEPGNIGEIYISGTGVSSGYLNNEELTKNVFLDNPYNWDSKMYKTGDLGYWDDYGQIICLGRIDDQVKVRGFRIELGDIESHLSHIPGIEKCKVISADTEHGKTIVGYFIGSQAVSSTYLVENLKKVLPDYMLPSYFVRVNEFKKTLNGKLDRSQLPDYIHFIKDNTITADKVFKNSSKECDVSRKVLQLCKKLIVYENLKLEDNFFHVGGDSLNLFRLNMHIALEWGITLSLADLYMCETIQDIVELIKANYIKEYEENKYSTRNNNTQINELEVTTFQRLLFAEEKKANRKRDKFKLHNYPTYNIIQLIKSNEYIIPEKLQYALNIVVKRHDCFNIIFRYMNKRYYMYTATNLCKDYFEYIFCESPDNINYVKSMARDFNISLSPLFQVILFENRNKEQSILLNIHHAIFDYMSLQIFIHELFTIYNDNKLPVLNRNYLLVIFDRYNEDKTQLINFWRDYYRNTKEAALFPVKNTEEKIRIYSDDLFGEEVFSLEGNRLSNLKRICRNIGISEYLFLFSAFSILLSGYSNKDDIIIGTYLPGRNTADITQMHVIGLFTEMLGIRFKVYKNLLLNTYLGNVKKDFLEVLKHQAISFSEIYANLETEELKYGQLYNIIFNYVIQSAIKINNDSREIYVSEISEEPETQPMGIKAFENKNNTIFKIRYAKRLYNSDYIILMKDRYFKIIEAMISNQNQSIEKLISDLFSEAG